MAKVKKIFNNDGVLVVPAGVKSVRAKKIIRQNFLKYFGIENGNDFTAGAGAIHFMDFDNNIFGWGLNGSFGITGILGDGSQTPNQSIPQIVTGGKKWRRQATGIAGPAGITLDGDLYAWGLNQGGAIGNGTNSNAYSVPQLVSGGLKFREARMPWGITLSGDLYMWGFNNSGALGGGFNTPPMVSAPSLVSGGLKWRKAKTNGNLSFGQDINGNWYSWGMNMPLFGAGGGELGAGLNPTAVNGVSSPILIQGGYKFRDIIFANGVWGITETNDLYVWGSGAPFFNSFAEGTITSSTPFITVNYVAYSTPHLVTNYGKIKSVAPYAYIGDPLANFGGSGARTMLTENGDLYSWGWDGVFFQSSCGNGLPQGSSSPVLIMPARKFKFMSYTNQTRHWAIEDNGDMWAWGENGNGALGIGIHDNIFVFRSTPTLVVGGRKWEWIIDDAMGVLAKSSDGTLWTWGATLLSNTAGFPANISSPVPVRNSLFFKDAEEFETNDIDVTPGSSYAIVVTTGYPKFGNTLLGVHPFCDRVEIEYDI